MSLLSSRLVDRVLTDRKAQFWALTVFGWLGYGFFVALSAFLWVIPFEQQLAYTLMAMSSGLILSLLLRDMLHRVWLMSLIKRGVLVLLSVGIVTALWSWLKMEIFFLLFEEKAKDRSGAEYLGWFTYSFFIFLSWTGLYFGIKYYQMLQDEKDKTLRATAMAHEAQLKMLRYQLNPHFLFNTLNAVSTLILAKETRTANAMVTELSKFLRYSLDNDPMQTVTLGQEVCALKLYLGIEKLRFEDRLHIQFDITDQAKDALIPSLLLQPLIENSIKYAIATNEQGGTIQLRAQVFAQELLLELSDTGPGISLNEGELLTASGVGLLNTRERLRVLYGDNHRIQFENMYHENGSQDTPEKTVSVSGLKVSMRIPFDKE